MEYQRQIREGFTASFDCRYTPDGFSGGSICR